MANIYIHELYTGKILHSLTVDRRVDLFPLDLSNQDLSDLVLNRADLQWANLRGSNLRGTKLCGATLFHADLTGADMRYCDVSGTDLREAILKNVDSYPLNTNKATKFLDARIDPDSELSTMASAITAARLRRSVEVDEFDLHQARKSVESLLDPNTKRLEKKVTRERRGWSLLAGNAVTKAQLRILRYTKNIELDRVRREKDLKFLQKQGVDLGFVNELLRLNSEETIYE